MTSYSKPDWFIPAGLIALSVIPIAAGTFRLIQLGVATDIIPENARFFAAPLPVILHIVSSVIYCVFGAFQFAPGVRRSHPDLHRLGGRILVACGLLAALTALWMNQFYPAANLTGPLPADFDGPSLYAVRLLAGTAMVLSLYLGLTAAMRTNIWRHRAWMMRGYAIGLGAGTQAFTHIPWFLFPSIHGEMARTLCMAAGWALNLVVAECLISREPRKI